MAELTCLAKEKHSKKYKLLFVIPLSNMAQLNCLAKEKHSKKI